MLSLIDQDMETQRQQGTNPGLLTPSQPLAFSWPLQAAQPWPDRHPKLPKWPLLVCFMAAMLPTPQMMSFLAGALFHQTIFQSAPQYSESSSLLNC